MQTPEAMKKIAKALHQDLFLFETTLEGIVSYAIVDLTAEESIAAKTFLTKLLDGSNDAATIREIWTALPKDIRIDDDQGMIELLSAIRDKLAG